LGHIIPEWLTFTTQPDLSFDLNLMTNYNTFAKHLHNSYLCTKQNNMKPRVYIDTSVIGGYYDEEFEEDTKKFFNRIFNEDFIIYFSEVSETELSLAPPRVRDLKNRIPKVCYRFIELDDVLVSWNFKHIVNFDKIKLFNSVNLKLGYPIIDIRSPLEFINHENND